MFYGLIFVVNMGANTVWLQLDDDHRRDLGIAVLKP